MLDYRGTDQRFRMNKNSKIIDAFLHNKGERLTIVYRGMCSYTFQLPKSSDGVENAKLRYYIEKEDLRGVFSNDDLYIQGSI